jgi:hypothetical protein
MRIALDYDDTFTLDRASWRKAVKALQMNPCTSVTFVTARMKNGGNEDIHHDANAMGIDIIFCNGKPKQECFNADVWIDDTPLAIPTPDAMRVSLLSKQTNAERLSLSGK